MDFVGVGEDRTIAYIMLILSRIYKKESDKTLVSERRDGKSFKRINRQVCLFGLLGTKIGKCAGIILLQKQEKQVCVDVSGRHEKAGKKRP